MRSKTKIITGLELFVLVVLIGFLFWNKTGNQEITTLSLKKEKETGELPLSYHIDNVPYYGEVIGMEEGFCYGYSAMMILEYYGFDKEKVMAFRNFVKNKGRGGPLDIFIGFKEYGLIDKIRVGYSKDYNQEYAGFYKSLVDEEKRQIVVFDSQKQAISKLKRLISSDIPVIVLINYGSNYDVAIGYDQEYIYLNDPHDIGGPNVKKSWSNFLTEWVVSEESGRPNTIGFPGDYGMIWLEGE